MKEKRNEGGKIMNIVAKSLEAVHTHTHTLSPLENKASIFPYTLLKLHARDG